jgi:hypothetical protein
VSELETLCVGCLYHFHSTAYQRHSHKPSIHCMSAAEAEAYSTNTGTTSLPALNMDKFRAFTNQVTSQVTPFAARSQQWIKEQTGSVAEKTELPHDYLELEVRVDALKTTHQKLLAATSQYTNEAYDYPPNVKESFQDLGKSIGDKVSNTSDSYCQPTRSY